MTNETQPIMGADNDRSAVAEDSASLPAVGTSVTFSKTVAECDVYQFAGISGDFSPNHVDEEYMRRTPYGQRIAHGVLAVAYMSTCSTKLIERIPNQPMVSYGYDRIRFIKPIFIGDTVTVTYTVAECDDADGRMNSDVTVHNQRGELVAVARHILQAVGNGR